MSRALLLALFFLVADAGGQTYVARHIVFKDPGEFTQQQLELASGMHAGAQANADSMSAAAQKLIDSGYFDDVTASLDGTADNASLIFNLKPTDRSQLLHVGFENFIWLKPADIDTAIRARLPLFNGYLAENSQLGDLVSAQLREALAAKEVSAQIDRETVEPSLLHPERTLEFRVTTPAIVVRTVHLSGVLSAFAPLVQKSVNATAGARYNDGLSNTRSVDTILAPLFDAGYIQAALTGVTLTPGPVSSTPAGDVLPVDITASLVAGEIYRVSAVNFLGAPLLSADAFRSTQKLHTGDVASRKLLLETLEPLDFAYRRQGYNDVIVRATPAFDDGAHTVAYTVDVVPGAQYRLKKTLVENLEPAARAAFERGFALKPGDLYNPDYVANFLKSNTAIKELSGYMATFKAYADPAQHTVDLVITFVPMTR